MGRDKASLPFGDETLLTRTVRHLSACAAGVIVVSAAGRSLPPVGAARVVHDQAPDQGPLHGVAIGLAAAAELADVAYVSAVDAPFVSSAFVRCMHRFVDGHDVALVADGGYRHPLAAAYRTHLHVAAEQMLAAGERRLLALVDASSTRTVSRSELLADHELSRADPDLRALDNVNTEEAYRAALAHLRP